MWLLAVAVAWAGTPTWEQARTLRNDDHYAVPSSEDRLALAELAADLLRAAPSGNVPAHAQDRAVLLGWRLEVEGDRLWLHQPPAEAAGGGLLAVRLGELPAEVVLQAPHPYYDKHTGRITGLLFDGGGVRAMMVATAHRDATPESDASHAIDSAFQALTLGVAAGTTDPLVVQLHGFSSKTSEADAVVSEGSARLGGSSGVEEAALMLRGVLGLEDVVDGRDEPALGARRNVQGRALADTTRFLHIELALEVREALRGDADLRDRLRGALVGLAGAP